MNAKVPIVLAVLVVLLGGYIYFVERDRPGTAARNERRRHLLQEYDEKRVLAVRFSDGVTLTAEGEGFDRRWRYPDKALANEDEVELYLSVWQHAVPLRTITLAGGADLQRFGFDGEALAIRLTMPSGDIEVALGTVRGSDGSYYVRIGDASVVRTVDEDVARAFRREGASFRTRPDGGYDLENLGIDRDGGTATADETISQ